MMLKKIFKTVTKRTPPEYTDIKGRMGVFPCSETAFSTEDGGT